MTKFLGKGGYGTVLGGYDLRSGRQVAIKMQTVEKTFPFARSVLREIVLQSHLSGVFVTQVLDVVKLGSPGSVAITQEFGHGTLENLRDNVVVDKCTSDENRNLRYQLMEYKRPLFHLSQAMKHCHKHGIIHRDIKTESKLLCVNH